MSMPKLRIGRHTAQLPIMQGGMGTGVSLAGLASAVAAQGGIGEISAVGLGEGALPGSARAEAFANTDLRKEIAKVRCATSGVLSVNIMLALTDSVELAIAAIEEEVDMISWSAGLPLHRPDELTACIRDHPSTAYLLKVSSSRAVELVFRFWMRHFGRLPDGVIIEGPLAGGHLGFRKEDLLETPPLLENIVLETLDIVTKYENSEGMAVPVIAAGGIFTGGDILKYLSLGASGVLMATRFVTTHECDAHKNFKDLYIQCREEDIVVIDSPLGLPGRAIDNRFLRDVANGARIPLRCNWQCIKGCDVQHAPYCIAQALLNARDGNLSEGFAFAGQNAWRCDRMYSVREVFEEIKAEYETACESRVAEKVEFRR